MAGNKQTLLNPNDLYGDLRSDHKSRFASQTRTFWYVPKSKNLYIKQYPNTHDDMLEDNPELFEDVWGFGHHDSFTTGIHFTRDYAVTETNAVAGRLGLHQYHEGVIVSFWGDVDKSVLGEFFVAAFKELPGLEEQKDKILVVRGKDGGVPEEFASIFGGEPAKKSVTFQAPKELRGGSKVNPYDTQFDIGGKRYSLADLRKMRTDLHVGNKSGMGVLCHPDIENYPELNGYRPAGCGGKPASPTNTGPAAWRAAGRAAGLPYVYSYGECEFREFMNFEDLFHEQTIRLRPRLDGCCPN